MPLVMKMALIEEFPARGRLFPSELALINAAAKCAATLKSLDVSLDSHFRDCAPDKRLEMGVQIGKIAANSSLTEVNLDGHALPIKKLKGTEPVESLDLSNKRLGVASAIVIASLIGVNGALTKIDLSRNHLGAEGAAALAPALAANGTLTEVNLDDVALPIKKLKGTEPVKSLDLSNKGLSFASAIVIASLIGVNGTLTSVDLRGNLLGDNGWGAIFAAICSNKDSKIMSLDSSCETII